ncbi:MAG: ATP synthase F1 subunit gamma [Pirellulaceae bacterium]|jgi:F-type H+-transporting ATPase subunit gamma|nr:ATP synthase F1 subunit gamma [Pirellulaceae bacterium]
MANIRELDKRRKSIRNIRKITRTMELIATARFKKAMDRASAANDYTQRITAIVRDLAAAGLEVSHPLLAERPEIKSSTILMLTSNRGLCGGYNGSVIRAAVQRRNELSDSSDSFRFEISGKRGIAAMKFRNVAIDQMYTNFEDQPAFGEVAKIADRLMEEFTTGRMDRLDVAYTRFVSVSKQITTVETLLPFSQPKPEDEPLAGGAAGAASGSTSGHVAKNDYEFLPSAESILEEVVPASFRVKLFKCFLDAAVSEQIARMVAMKSATENAGDIIKQLSTTFNRARQSKITQEIMEIIGGVEALEA